MASPGSSPPKLLGSKRLKKLFTGSKLPNASSARAHSSLPSASSSVVYTGGGNSATAYQQAHHTPTIQELGSSRSSATGPSGSAEIQQLSTQHGATSTKPPVHPHGRVVNPSLANTQPPTSNYLLTAKDYLGVTWSFTQLLIKKLPDVSDGNPVKIALGLAKIIVEITEAVKDNMDAVEKRLALTGSQLFVVMKALESWKPSSEDHKQEKQVFEDTLNEQLNQLLKVKHQSLSRQVATNEDNKKQIAEIFERVNDARVRFQLVTGLGVFRKVYEIQAALNNLLFDKLKPSVMADHRYSPEGKEEELLRREVCTPGTRGRILKEAITWINDASLDSSSVFWLTGQAGSGKTTIAYTIARRFEIVGSVDDPTILGGNFLCSRQFPETRYQKCIIRTIVYQLARKCKPFADCLSSCDFETVTHNVRAQIEELLVKPWKDSERERQAEPQYLIIIDALDEIDGTGGSDFLRDLLDAINEHKLRGLKFFATSRPSQDLLTHLEGLGSKQLYRLEHVPIEEAQADIAIYVNTKLSKSVGGEQLNELVAQAAGLFIYAATVVKHLVKHRPIEQQLLLQKLLAAPDSTQRQTSPPSMTRRLDELYHQILVDAFGDIDEDLVAERIQILHTFLCTAERTSTSIVAGLIRSDDSNTEIADDVLTRLHAVLYTKEDQVLWYHTSFRDFLFERARSKDFSCDKAIHHQLLTKSCFRVMEAGLKFNIGNISTSFLLDSENAALRTNVKNNISTVLSYSCRNWDYHLSAIAVIDFGSLLAIISEFLQVRVLFWIEVMNLLGSGGQCYPMLQSALEWASTHDTALAEDINEVAIFTTHFIGSPASLSTPHLYISALATWSRDTHLSQKWKGHFPRIPRFTRAGSRSTALVTLHIEGAVVTFSSDDRRIVSGSNCDNSVRVWDASTGKELKELKGHVGPVKSVACSNDDKHIASGSKDCSARLWDASTGDIRKVLEGHTRAVNTVAFSRNNKYIVSGSWDKSVRLWDASTGVELMLLEGHTEMVSLAAFLNDDRHVVSSSDDNSVRVWDVLTGEALRVLDSVCSPVTFSRKAGHILSGSSGLAVWDISTGVRLKNKTWTELGDLFSVAFSSDDRHIVTSSWWSNLVKIWNTSTREELKVLAGHTSRITSVAFSSDDRRIISTSDDGSVRVWDASKREGLGTPMDDVNSPICSAAFSSDGKCIVSGWYGGSVQVYDASTGELLKVLKGHTASINAVAFSRDDKHIVSGSNDWSVRVWDASTGEVVRVLEEHTKSVKSVAFSSDTRSIISGSGDKSVRMWDVLTGDVKVLEGHTDQVSSVAFSRNDKHIVSGSYDDSVRLWDAATGKVLKAFEGHQGDVNSVAFSSDDRYILSASDDCSIRVWSISTGEVLMVLEGQTKWISGAAFSSNDRYIVFGLGNPSDNYSVLVRDASTGEVLKTLRGHTDSIRTVAFSSDDKFIVSCSNDGTVRVWDVSAGRTSLEYLRETEGAPSSHEHQKKHTGWLVSLNKQDHLMFVPPDAGLPDYANILTIPRSSAASVDFSDASIGTEWAKCYRP